MHTKYGRGIAAKGVQPICNFQQVFKSTYQYGAFSPINGNKLILEFPYCNSECFQIFLNIMSKQNKDEFKIIVLDNGAFHKSKSLEIPSNILLLFLPPYSPELNPAEKIWHHIKRVFTNRFFNTLDEVNLFFTEVVKNLTTEKVKSVCSYKYIFSGLNWSV